MYWLVVKHMRISPVGSAQHCFIILLFGEQNSHPVEIARTQNHDGVQTCYDGC